MHEMGKILLVAGAVLLAVGWLLIAADKIHGLGRLPGDILIRKGHFTFYAPLATCLLVSVLLTVLFSIFRNKP